jgi:hypothetical protein
MAPISWPGVVLLQPLINTGDRVAVQQFLGLYRCQAVRARRCGWSKKKPAEAG